MSEETKPHWYLVQARPRQAALAVEHLERQGYCVFHPRLHVEQLRRGRPVVVAQALFPDYLFIRLQAGVDNFGPVRSTRGVAQLVGFGTVPVPFDAALVESLRRHLAAADGVPGEPRAAVPAGTVQGEAATGEAPAPDPGVAALLGLAEPRERIRALMGLVSPPRGRVRALIGAGE
mgnify:CR=1 FL=1